MDETPTIHYGSPLPVEYGTRTKECNLWQSLTANQLERKDAQLVLSYIVWPGECPDPRLVGRVGAEWELAAERYFVTQARTKSATTSVPTTISTTNSPTGRTGLSSSSPRRAYVTAGVRDRGRPDHRSCNRASANAPKTSSEW